MEWINELQKIKLNKTYTQYGEESALNFIFKNIGTTNKYLVDFGAGDGNWLSNSKLFLENGWDGLLMDGNPKDSTIVKKEFITAENICNLFEKYNVYKEFDLLSLDIDGNDLWVLKEIMEHQYLPRVIILEFNASFARGISKTIKYNPEYVCNGTNYFGASFEAFNKLMKEYNYSLVMQIAQTNLIFINNNIIEGKDYGITYTPAQFFPDLPGAEWVEY